MLHLINCLLLAFAPHVIIYKATQLCVNHPHTGMRLPPLTKRAL